MTFGNISGGKGYYSVGDTPMTGWDVYSAHLPEVQSSAAPVLLCRRGYRFCCGGGNDTRTWYITGSWYYRVLQQYYVRHSRGQEMPLSGRLRISTQS